MNKQVYPIPFPWLRASVSVTPCLDEFAYLRTISWPAPRSELCPLPIAVFPKSVCSGLGLGGVGQILWGVLSCLVVSYIVSSGPGLSCLVMSCWPSLMCMTLLSSLLCIFCLVVSSYHNCPIPFRRGRNQNWGRLKNETPAISMTGTRSHTKDLGKDKDKSQSKGKPNEWDYAWTFSFQGSILFPRHLHTKTNKIETKTKTNRSNKTTTTTNTIQSQNRYEHNNTTEMKIRTDTRQRQQINNTLYRGTKIQKQTHIRRERDRDENETKTVLRCYKFQYSSYHSL
jgi:hypothetical protein